MIYTSILLVIIFICYIGLGVPDSLLGAAWPAIYTEFGVPVSSVNLITVLISGGTILSSLVSADLVKRLGTGKVTAISTAMTAIALSGFSISHNLLWLCIFAIPLGLGAGSIDVALNNYVALHYKASHMNFLHCFYGIGVSLSPYLMSLALSSNNNWRGGYHSVSFLQWGIAIMSILALPLWKKVEIHEDFQEEPHRNVRFRDLLKTASIRSSCSIMIASCGIESVCLIWGSTYLAQGKGLAPSYAAKLITLYFVGLTLGRFLSGFLAQRLSSWKIIRLGQLIVLFAVILLFLPVPGIGAAFGLLLVGLGNGPLFPNMTHLAPICFGRDISESVIALQMAGSYCSILLAPVIFGQMVQHFSIHLYAPFLALLFVFMMIMSRKMQKLTDVR
ncbi:MAG: MFS transporter [Lachnospiraceae bacterium]|nr:MFS transporter [Lachnospiraceae bacterium]